MSDNNVTTNFLVVKGSCWEAEMLDAVRKILERPEEALGGNGLPVTQATQTVLTQVGDCPIPTMRVCGLSLKPTMSTVEYFPTCEQLEFTQMVPASLPNPKNQAGTPDGAPKGDTAGSVGSVAPTPTFNLVVKDGERGVDLRELHQELEIGQDFTTWARFRLSDFVEGLEFEELYAQADENSEEVFHKTVKNSGGRPRRGWSVSIECAKHIAMMERTERGRQVRQYFIDFEKAVRGSYRNGNRPHGALCKMTPSEFVRHHKAARI